MRKWKSYRTSTEKTEPYPRSSHHEKSPPVTHTAGVVLPFGFAIIFGAVTAVLIVTAIIVSGLAVSGAEQRANYHSETEEGRHARLKMAAVFFCAALPSAGCLLITLL
ncbi:DUF5316 family protein [Bacillus velezensis]|uniref:DUF5316 family protein n=1 Tax=Bacillus velezensis TaxID=492670 RepID=UPI003D7FD47C